MANTLQPTAMQKLNPKDITDAYKKAVIDVILNGCYDQTTLPSIYGFTFSHKEILANKNNEIYNPETGYSKEKDVAKSSSFNIYDIYNSLVETTKYLLRVGTFTISVQLQYDRTGRTRDNHSINIHRFDPQGSISGKAFFTQAFAENPTAFQSHVHANSYSISNGYTDNQNHQSDFSNARKDLDNHPKGSYPNHLKSVDNAGVLTTKIFSAKSINDLITNCYNRWNESGRPRYNETFRHCHDNCHGDCHSNCHGDCHDICNCDGGCHDGHRERTVGYQPGACYGNKHADGSYLNIVCNYIYEDY